MQFVTEIVPADRLPQHLQPIDERDSTDGIAVYSRIPGNQFRKIRYNIHLDDAGSHEQRRHGDCCA
jgi:phosphate transport system permease protein